ncbi:hypothetical protein RRF57_011519 [Xylaria bambusicola]|uniref:Uncharacterized protein n=1 Tax=Xylaria bambusicola TaxID=326684 RepID=A0AAN7Z9X3_9PEZI
MGSALQGNAYVCFRVNTCYGGNRHIRSDGDFKSWVLADFPLELAQLRSVYRHVKRKRLRASCIDDLIKMSQILDEMP